MFKSFKCQYHVNLDDLDFMGIIGHPTWLIILERVRTQILKEPYKLLLKEKQHLVITEANVKYKRPARYDETLDFLLEIIELKNTYFTIRHTVRNEQAQVCLTGELTLASINEKGKPARLQSDFRNYLNP